MSIVIFVGFFVWYKCTRLIRLQEIRRIYCIFNT